MTTEVVRCHGTTKAGKRCSRFTRKGRYCWEHRG